MNPEFRKFVACAILAGLLLAQGTFQSVHAKPRKRVTPSAGWVQLENSRKRGAIQAPSVSSQLSQPQASANKNSQGSTQIPIGFPEAAHPISRSLARDVGWANIGDGTRIRAIAPGTKTEPVQVESLSPWNIEPSETFSKPQFQMANPPPQGGAGRTGGNPPPITGAQPMTLLSPNPQAAPAPDPSSANVKMLTPVGLTLPPGVDQTITLDFRDQDIRDAFRSLAQIAKLNLMIDPTITGTISLTFSNISLEEAFNTLLRTQNLEFSWEGQILRIFMPANAPLVAATFFIRNTAAETVDTLIKGILNAPRETSAIDRRQNSIEVRATYKTIQDIKQRLPFWDVAEAQIEAPRAFTEVFYLDYIDATTLIGGGGAGPIGMVAPNARVTPLSSNQASQAGAAGGAGTGRQDILLVSAEPGDLEKIRELIEKLDVAPIQVTIDAHIYELDLNEEERLGINWQKQIPIAGTTENVFDMSIAPETSDAGGTGVFRFGSLNVNQFRALLAMLKTHSFAKVLSNPVITTLNNRTANITVGQAIPYVSASTVNAETGQVSNTISQANANITLNVTPSVTGNDEVFLDITPTISSVLGFTSLGGNSTPNLSNRSAQTQVIIKNNNTIVIGGMIKTDKSDTISKVPYFADLPGIGKLFQKKTTKEIRTELIIFITPHIVRSHGKKKVTATAEGQINLPRLSLQP